ncbi:MAG TPA: hypothetical protein VG319_00495 [Polyangia bacterium]|jgi:hypothetical protein|nr:hypothetical protein [Polyangia bacterium]
MRAGRICGAGPLVGATVVALLGAACGTAYQPAASPRIGIVIRHGVPWYVKEGAETPIGPLGGNLPALVAGEPDAVRYARRARRQLVLGVPAYVCGLAAVVVGAAIAKPAGWFAAGAGVATAGVGLSLMGAGTMNAVDAINVYNDHVENAASR